MEQKRYEFDGMIHEVLDNGGAYVIFPWDIREEFGKGRIKARTVFAGLACLGLPWNGNARGGLGGDSDGHLHEARFVDLCAWEDTRPFQKFWPPEPDCRRAFLRRVYCSAFCEFERFGKAHFRRMPKGCITIAGHCHTVDKVETFWGQDCPRVNA